MPVARQPELPESTGQEQQPAQGRRKASALFERDVLVHVGLHKTGTTWLQKNLFGTDHAGFAHFAEAGADPKSAAKRIGGLLLAHTAASAGGSKSPEQLLADLLGRDTSGQGVPVVSNEALGGSAFVEDFGYPRNTQRILEIFSKPKILLILRNQHALIKSDYLHYCRAGGRLSLEQVFGPEAKANGPPALEYWYYDRMIEHYFQNFGRQRVCVLPYEMFRDDPRRFISCICAFAGAPEPPELPTQSRENQMEDLFCTLAMRHLGFVNRPPADRPFYPKNSFRKRILLPAHRTIRRLCTSLAPASWQEAAREKLERRIHRLIDNDRMQRSNRRAQQLTGLDLGKYGYVGL